jgi:hypothetical protein
MERESCKEEFQFLRTSPPTPEEILDEVHESTNLVNQLENS